LRKKGSLYSTQFDLFSITLDLSLADIEEEKKEILLKSILKTSEQGAFIYIYYQISV